MTKTEPWMRDAPIPYVYAKLRGCATCSHSTVIWVEKTEHRVCYRLSHTLVYCENVGYCKQWKEKA